MRSPRTGVALLIALASVIVVLAALAATLAALASGQRAVVVSDLHDRQQDLLRAGEDLARAWIIAHAKQVVWPPGGGPVRVANDHLRIAGSDARLQVWMFDGLAAIPLPAAQVGGILRGALPGRWSTVMPPVSHDPRTPDLIERTVVAAGMHRFPLAPAGVVVRWSPAGEPLPDAIGEEAAVEVPGTSLVETIAFRSNGRINRNTAPEWLLSAVYQLTERGGLEEALRQRERGVFNDEQDPDGQPGVQLVAASDWWQALVVTTWNGRQRSWWVELSGNSAGVRIVQRHDADE